MKVASLHGEMSKMERQQVLAKFRAGGYRAMVRRPQFTPEACIVSPAKAFCLRGKAWGSRAALCALGSTPPTWPIMPDAFQFLTSAATLPHDLDTSQVRP